MSITRSRIAIVRVMMMVITLTSCDEAVGIVDEFSPASQTAAVETMSAVGTASDDAFASMAVASPLFAGSASGALLPSDRRMVTTADAQELIALQYAPLFPANYLGVTFTYDEAAGEYSASERAGAPLDGVRVVYYAIDPITHEPAVPLNELGHIDVRDLGAASSERMGMLVVRTSSGSSVTLADYYVDVRHVASNSGPMIIMAAPGFLSNGTERIDFDLNQRLLVNSARLRLTQDHVMSLAGSNVSIAFEGELTTEFETDSVAYEMTSTITGNGGTVTLGLSAHNELLEGEIRHNARRIAQIDGTSNAPLFTDANGQPFEVGEREGISDLFDAVDALLELADGIFATSEAE